MKIDKLKTKIPHIIGIITCIIVTLLIVTTISTKPKKEQVNKEIAQPLQSYTCTKPIEGFVAECSKTNNVRSCLLVAVQMLCDKN